MIGSEEKYMKRALYLASLAEGYTQTNPMVGCVIVDRDEIIGEGYHRIYGEAHAEVNAINSVKEQDKERLKTSTLYVNLEPCAHYGKTPPCADLIVKHKIPRVVIGCKDTYSQVNGKGIEILRSADTEVVVGMLEEQSQFLNRRFFCYNSKSRPYIILKWAQTVDGYIDNDRAENTPQNWLTNRASKELVHKMRAAESAIMVGSKTVKMDNPSLTVREWSGENPTRIVLDRKLALKPHYSIFNDQAPTLIINEIKADQSHIKVDFSSSRWITDFLSQLHQRKICSLIVEGGTKTLNMFIDNNLYDESHIFISPLTLSELKHSSGKGGVQAPHFPLSLNHTTTMIENIMVKKVFNYDSI